MTALAIVNLDLGFAIVRWVFVWWTRFIRKNGGLAKVDWGFGHLAHVALIGQVYGFVICQLIDPLADSGM